jgi:hypothetical protein
LDDYLHLRKIAASEFAAVSLAFAVDRVIRIGF